MDSLNGNSPAQVLAADAARTSYGRLLALLAASTGDIAGAEDALSDAFERALTCWPVDGVPDNPDGWLLTVARNRRRDEWKSAAATRNIPLDPGSHVPVHLDDIDIDAVPDKRLGLMLVCAHPAIDPLVRTPLMLDVVLGFTAKEIAVAFDLPATTLAARLVRAKRRIKNARISFEIPDRSVLPDRIASVLDAVYGAFAIDWHGAGTEVRDNFTAEALHLAETLSALVPDDAEAHGLAALIALTAARFPARYDDAGRLVPLSDQDPALWNEVLMLRGEQHLRQAHALGVLGRLQLEAAIASVHCARRRGPLDRRVLVDLHRTLHAVAPTIGGSVALAAVVAEIDGAAAGLALLDAVDGAERFQPAWATRAHLLARSGRADAARAAFDKAISLTTDTPMREHLEGMRSKLDGPGP